MNKGINLSKKIGTFYFNILRKLKNGTFCFKSPNFMAQSKLNHWMDFKDSKAHKQLHIFNYYSYFIPILLLIA